MRSLQRTIIFSLGLLLILAACGRTNTQPAVQPASQSGQGSVVNTATAIVPSPTLAKKFVFDTQVARSIATELALSPTSQPPILTFPPSPTLYPDVLSNSCEPFRGFIPRNCWLSERRNLGVHSGSKTVYPQQGRILVFNDGRAIYDTPQRIGSIKIHTVNYPIVDLYTNTTHLLFNLETRQWLDVDGTPLPTATP
ncbi:hypothetical protein [Herpetosiphon giganteus]|uniref:hypothetical protein n=1 Tax=Herpetosiphon giganteus TaxID=2029754 RepID=UPI00195AC4D5|nr:hypothetical protein [Herpetosiphon giganteus]MBM7845979.1 hypothetical protein [Herpetosiphon giganteus]